ncbi:hypothetical protein [Noviherbaspirillum sp. Root189]|uniref:hypothetical protein n=1 Tax=Noviherbaspirillum sp. Root189 TaxID=1736487 RepID=UPI00070D970A|nr:hypothetical protein [Noviherbaspirillum sp. Root189]
MDQHPLSQQMSLKPYRLMRRAGLITSIGAGAAALAADFPASAGIIGVAGCALYFIGLLGAWWNT